MPLVTHPSRLAVLDRTRRHADVRARLRQIPPELMGGVSPEAVAARAAALGLVPGQRYGPHRGSAVAMGAAPYIGELMFFGGNFAPQGWLRCQGQLLAIAEYDTLYALIGTTYGGDGQNTFALPDLRGRLPLHAGLGAGPGQPSYVRGQAAGTETVTLTTSQIPSHQHTWGVSSSVGTQASPSGARPAAVPASGKGRYAPTAAGTMSASTVGSAGGSQSHNNLSPYLVLTICIATEGVYPSP